jgi:hypothetical protein
LCPHSLPTIPRGELMEPAGGLNTYEMVKANPDLDDSKMANLLIKTFTFSDNANWYDVHDLVRTIRKQI